MPWAEGDHQNRDRDDDEADDHDGLEADRVVEGGHEARDAGHDQDGGNDQRRSQQDVAVTNRAPIPSWLDGFGHSQPTSA